MFWPTTAIDGLDYDECVSCRRLIVNVSSPNPSGCCDRQADQNYDEDPKTTPLNVSDLSPGINRLEQYRYR
jgi:hypothetical protein